MKNTLRLFSGLTWAWILSLVLAPLVFVIVVSFASRGSFGGIDWVFGLDQYRRILSPEMGPLLLASLGRSVVLALATTVLCVLAAFPLSLFLVFRAGKWKDVLFFLLIIPFWTNFLIRTYAWIVILSDNGWLVTFLRSMGFEIDHLDVLFTNKAVLLGMFYNYLPYMALSLYVSAEKLDVKLLEAAGDLGAGPAKRFFTIIVPLCMPGLIAGSIMVFIPALGEFVIPDILGGGTTLFVGNLLTHQFLTARNWPFGAALSVFLILIVGFCLLVLAKSENPRGAKR